MNVLLVMILFFVTLSGCDFDSFSDLSEGRKNGYSGALGWSFPAPLPKGASIRNLQETRL